MSDSDDPRHRVTVHDIHKPRWPFAAEKATGIAGRQTLSLARCISGREPIDLARPVKKPAPSDAVFHVRPIHLSWTSRGNAEVPDSRRYACGVIGRLVQTVAEPSD